MRLKMKDELDLELYENEEDAYCSEVDNKEWINKLLGNIDLDDL
jgi:hypothetical protein